VPFESKVEEVLGLLREGKVKIVFDAETESCDLRELSKPCRPSGRAWDADSSLT
jgi:uncharacterized protein YheU (UPF0270 family)